VSAFFSGTIPTVPALVLLLVAVTCAVTDVWKGRIYNAVTYPTMVIGLGLQLALHGAGGLWIALGGFAVGFFPGFLLFALGGMGGGDVKLLGAIGVLAGVAPTTEALVLAFFFGALFALGKLAWHGVLFRSLWRTVRQIAASVVPGLKRPDTTGLPHLEVRFGVAICIATMATLWDLRSGAISSLVLG
jgi:prepilin peptidase CpaA